MTSRIEKLCLEKGMRMTDQRRVIAKVISDSSDHPDVEEVFSRASVIDANISLATVYRTVRMLEEANIVEKHDFGDGRARYEEITDSHHDHLIDIKSGKILEFYNEEIEHLKTRIAKEMGYKLIDHRLELFAVPLEDSSKK